jgi:hypothetical protein
MPVPQTTALKTSLGAAALCVRNVEEEAERGRGVSQSELVATELTNVDVDCIERIPDLIAPVTELDLLVLNPSPSNTILGITPSAILDFTLPCASDNLTIPSASLAPSTLPPPPNGFDIEARMALSQGPTSNAGWQESAVEGDPLNPTLDLMIDQHMDFDQAAEHDASVSSSPPETTYFPQTIPFGSPMELSPSSSSDSPSSQYWPMETVVANLLGPADDIPGGPNEHQCVPDLMDSSVYHTLYNWNKLTLSMELLGHVPPRCPAWGYNQGPIIAPPRVEEVIGMSPEGDIQGIDWKSCQLARSEVRAFRMWHYSHIRSSVNDVLKSKASLSKHAKFPFQFHRTNCRAVPGIEHFQLRNTVEATSQHDLYYASKKKVMRADLSSPIGSSAAPSVVMDLHSPNMHSTLISGFRVTSLTTVSNNILVAGGFGGDYAYINLESESSSKHTSGLASKQDIVNHVGSSPGHANPTAVLCLNDPSETINILDCTTNRIIEKYTYKPDNLRHSLAEPVVANCTSTSPDGRLRLIVGDFPGCLLTDARSGKLLKEIPGHHHNAFACAWAEDGWSIATAAEDNQVRLWDARKWSAVASFRVDNAPVRTLRFSPLGRGPQLLFAGEARDFVHVVETKLWRRQQRLNFFGDVAGLAVAADGSELVVGNGDMHYGGMMVWARSSWYESHDDSVGEQQQQQQPLVWRDFEMPGRARGNGRPAPFA